MTQKSAAPLLEQDAEPQTGLVPSGDTVSMFERLATNKDVDVEKLQRLIDMQERILKHNAEAAFNAAFAEMQAQIPTIAERGVTDKGRYATFEDIVEGVRPVLQQFGFSLSFRTEWPDKKTVKVFGILTHRDGHSRASEFMADADQSGSKNAIQALGSAVSYGRRYTTRDLLNIASRDEDDDGERSARAGKPDVQEPDGYDAWLANLEGIAGDGWAMLSDVWNKSKETYRKHLINTNQRDRKSVV